MTVQTFEKFPPPVIVPRAEHRLSRKAIGDYALKVLYRLKSAGFEAYLVGGAVRDLLLGREPKDFDVATDARPEQVRELFSNSRLIGRRFKLVHVHFGSAIVEVATFRGTHDTAEDDPDTLSAEGMILRDNVYGDLEQDAWRRDFTVNSLYYNIRDFSVVDYTGGLGDLEAGQLRLIGDPDLRYKEDPVRMLRAVRFAAKLGFRIHPASEAPLRDLGDRLESVPPARLFDELLKLFMTGSAVSTYELLRHYDLFKYLFPLTDASLAQEEGGFPHTLVLQGLANTDERVGAGKPVTPAFLFAVVLWYPMIERARALQAQGMPEVQAMQVAGDQVFSAQQHHISIPKRFSLQSREIWFLQTRLAQRQGKRAFLLVDQPRFRAGYDFLLLRAQAGDQDQQALCDWWTQFQVADEGQRQALVASVRTEGDGGGGGQRRTRRRGKRRTSPPA